MQDRIAPGPDGSVPDAGDTVLTVENLSIDFHLRTHILHAVRNVSFDLHRGGTFCLVGESGSGKSVTARALLRIIDKEARVTGGRIILKTGPEPLDLTALGEDSRQIRDVRGGRIGLVFQEPMSSLSPVHTIGSQIVEALRLHRHMDKRAALRETVELLRQVEIADPENMVKRYTFEFSGGMRQRAMIAMALACDPDILIADEPTTALDVTTQAEILDLIKRLQMSRGMAMLLITHDLGVVAEVADRVAVMRYGEIVEQGSVDDIFYRPSHPYTRRLLESTVRLEHHAHVGSAADPSEPVSPPRAVLSVRGLTKAFGAGRQWLGSPGHAFKAVDDVSFDLEDGENLGIVGESGSGKTTLGRLILRIMDPTAGNVIYRPDAAADEVNVTDLDKRNLRKFHAQVRLIFQDPFSSLNPRMTVKQIIGEPLLVNGRAKGKALEERVGELMETVGLDPAAMERFPHAFSGGQRQRIGIARALALDPRIIIADEATSALDVSIRAQILDLLLGIQERLRLSFIFISHDIAVVRYFCQRVAVMHKGKIVEIGSAEQICTEPQQPYTQSLISAVPNPDPRNKRMLHRTRFVA
ncbi:ABC transporter ATP-binding protein [Bauldia sp.]|uniref:ABC transporter ATP-binding protein n=1 Tax=Bauldia sp. TaxID=2575872 RepID=UPI003BA9E7EF